MDLFGEGRGSVTSSVPPTTSVELDMSPMGAFGGKRLGNENNSAGDICTALDNLSVLPRDVLVLALRFLTAAEVVESVQLVSKLLRKVCNSSPLWKEFCLRTGKGLPVFFAATAEKPSGWEAVEMICNVRIDGDPLAQCDARRNIPDSPGPRNQGINPPHRERDHYFQNPCVPIDFDTIAEAMKHCSNGCTVTIMPGVYNEQIHVTNTNLTVRAAFPDIGAALVHHCHADEVGPSSTDHDVAAARNNPCVNIHSAASSSLDGPINGGSLRLSHLQILHSSPGSDIWGGNCAVRVDGVGMRLLIDSCTLQSDSGRGVVATNGACLEMTRTVLHDCAATGLYVGDLGTRARIWECNVIRNGNGSRLPRRRRGTNANRSSHQITAGGVDSDSDMHEALDEPDDLDPEELVPPGHSGMYVETASALIENSLIAANSLTGLSVVRGGAVRLSGCDVASNGAEPVSVEDAHDVLFGNAEGRLTAVRGGVVEGPAPNRLTPDLAGLDTDAWTDTGENVRHTPFPLVVQRRTSDRKLRQHFRKQASLAAFYSE